MNPCLPCQDDNVANCECPICVECGRSIPPGDFRYTIHAIVAGQSKLVHGPFCAPCIRESSKWPEENGVTIAQDK